MAKKQSNLYSGLGWFIFGCLMLSACSTNQQVIIEDISIYPSASTSSSTSSKTNKAQARLPKSGTYAVNKGDTLYAIAWRYGWDYKALAKANNIKAPYTIYIGQTLVVNPAIAKTLTAPAKEKANNTHITQQSTTKPTVKKTKAVKSVVSTYKGKNNLVWHWPLRGKILAHYAQGKDKNKGIDIAASLGSSVKAATSGQVVYAGDGLQGYGNLVIIKHNDKLLSAYAYNQQILVSEGDVVKSNQVVAKSGQGPKADGRLHFEIRKDGKPVNPTAYLPK